MSRALQVIAAYQDKFKAEPSFLIRSPGRANLIGEHTDYNDGFVFPMAINRSIWVAVGPRRDTRVLVHSLDKDAICDFDASSIREPLPNWGTYIQGVAWALDNANVALNGWNGVLVSEVPIGSGLSTSAALELAAARCFTKLAGHTWDPVQMAQLCQKAENDWVGMNCGIMDQLIVAAGQKDHALLIDCRSLEMKQVALPEEAVFVVMDTATRRGLVDSAYNERRQQCEIAADVLNVPFLRDVTSDTLKHRSQELDALTLKRSRHVISENERTVAAAYALEDNDLPLVGQLMDASHDSLRDDYEVTNDALNTIVSLARSHPECLGARMTGGGFGGCAIALVSKEGAEAFVGHVKLAYEEKTGLQPVFFICQADAGVSIEEIA